uniref:interleukin 17a/f3 n=1 Tax=Scatophagus argus TaxID=75038 RepID=UPI001ED82D55|nr:interleukin 17a/f3 [Scatophagus argus]
MQLVLGVLLVLGLATLLHGARKSPDVSVMSKKGREMKGRTVRLILNPLLQPQITGRSVSAIANMSLSPWMYRESYEASRLPARISNAQCLTSGCLSLQGGGEDAALVAEPIKYQILVLHRVQRQRRNNKKGRKARKKYDFRLGTEVITVGCTCVRPSVIPQL